MLVVEDQAAMRVLLCEFLQSAFPEYSVAAAADGRSAMDLVRELRPRLVLMDINLPDANGVELTQRIRRDFPDTQVIVVTEMNGSAYVERAAAAGAFAYVTKDRIYHELLPAAARALGIAAKSAPGGGETQQIHSDRLSVLIVEDSASDAELLCARLESYKVSFAVRVVDNEADFLAALDPSPDVILSDYSLPGFSGMRALELARKRGVDSPFILVSGTVGEEAAVAAMHAGADDYLFKDRLTRLGPAVERALERKRIERERRRNHAEMIRLATIVENSNDAIISRTLDGIVTSWNRGAERLFGYSADEAIGRPVSELTLPLEIQRRVAKNIEAVQRGEVVPPYETQRKSKSGRLIDVLSSVSPIRDEAGKVAGASIILRDITERKAAENESLRRAAVTELLESLARAVNEAATPEAALRSCLIRICEHGDWSVGRVAIFDSEQTDHVPRTTIWHGTESGRYEELIRRSARKDHNERRGHFVGRALRERMPVWIAEITQDPGRGRLLLAAKAGLRAGFVFPVIVRDQVAAFLEFFAEQAREPDTLLLAAIGGVAAQLARVIERARALDELRKSEHQMRLVTDNVPAMIAYFDADLRCRFANRSFCEFRDIPPERAAGMSRAEIVAGDVEGATDNPDIAALREGRAGITRRRFRTKGGELRHIEVSRVPDLSPEGAFRGYYAMLLDVTQQVQAQADIKRSEARLRAILDNEPECVKLLKTDGSLLEINRAGLAMLDAEDIGQVRECGLMNFVLPEYRGRFQDFVRQSATVASSELEFEVEGLKGTRRWMQSYAAPMRFSESEGDTLIVVTRDVTERKRAEQRADYLAHHDSLTGLPNRNLLRDRIELVCAAAEPEPLGVLVVNLDRFKEVNESLGTEAGDELLRAFALRVRGSLRQVETLARLGGNEFALLVRGAPSVDSVVAVAENLIGLLVEPFRVRDREIFVSASIGVAVYPYGTVDAHSLLQSAEIAMTRVKREGGGGYQVFRTQPDALRGKRLDFDSRLRRALANGEFSVHYQPKVSLISGAVTGAEALLRWNNPDLGQVSPALFIPLVEETGQIIPIGAWILEIACVQAARWRDRGHELSLAVNLSPRQFRQKNLAGTVAAILARSGLPAENLELEITEGTAMSNAEQTVGVLADLHRLGVRLAVDDFGTGYSSLSYLRRFPLHCLKIDGSFVRDVTTDAHNEAIVRATIALGHSLKLKAIAEGVETEAQRDFLAHAGCDEYQGFYFSRPLPVGEFSKLLGTGA